MKLLILLPTLLFSFFSFSSDNVMLDKAIKAAQSSRVKDPSSPVFSCMLSQWEGKYIEAQSNSAKKIQVFDVFGYERFLACYRSASKIGATGEIGVDTEKWKVPNGTRFRARVVCKNGTCSTEWKDTECCFTIDLEKY